MRKFSGIRPSSRLATLCVSLGLAACGGDDADSSPAVHGELATPEQACAERCSLLADVGCPDDAGKSYADCEQSCMQLFGLFPSCEAELLNVANCAPARAASGWHCASSGEAVIAEGVCTAETTALEQCFIH
jgi:hypothetical protein